MAYYNEAHHPLDSTGDIEEIDLSKSSSSKIDSKITFYTPNENIHEINMSNLKKQGTPPPVAPKILFTPERSKTRSPKPDTPPSPPTDAYKPKANKRIAPRILPKIPDHSVEATLVTKSSPLRQNSVTSSTEQNFFISIDQVGWFYKKDPLDTNSLKSYSSTVSNMEDYEETNGTSLISQEGGSNNSSIVNNSNSKKWHTFNRVDSMSLELGYRCMVSEKLVDKLVQVLDDLYEVNLSTKKCYAIYWKGRRTFTVMRSVWFQESGEPFEEKSSDEIESKHVELYRDYLQRTVEIDWSINSDMEQLRMDASSPTEEMKKSGGETTPKIIDPVGSVNLEQGVVTWYGKDDVYWEKNKMSLIEKMNFGLSKFRNKFNGMKIKRGFRHPKVKETSEQEEKYQEVTHLVFVVHGIAQKMYENGIVKNCEELRQECEKKKKEYFPSYKSQRYMFLPVDWRSSLTLDDGIVETITPNSIQLIREKLNSSALDIMYYTSPLFRIEILNSLSSELNRLYDLFCQKNPYFKEKSNKVSFVAHSLGTVIVYDIITSDNSTTQFSNTYGQVSNHQLENFRRYSQNDNDLLNEYLTCKNRIQEIENNLVKSNNNIMPLGFQPVNFFSLGSPLAVFLAMRGVRPAGTGSQEHILPKHLCQHLYNIFHPSDPIAYRVEPLIIKHYTNKSPLEIQKSDVAPKITYKELNEKRTAFQLSNDTSNVKSSKSSKNKKDKELEESIGYRESTGVSLQANSPTIEQVELESALDFQLQDSNFELMATLRAHTCYWKSSDTALFILSQLIINDSGDSG